MNLTKEYKIKVISELLNARQKFGGTDGQFAKQFTINPAVYSRIKGGEVDGIISDVQYLNIGRMLNISTRERSWKLVKTLVYKMIEEEVMFCKQYSKARILVDEPEIGKTFAAKHLARTIKNCFYLDCSQAKTKKVFVQKIAKAIGVDQNGKVADVMENVKYGLNVLDAPVVILDEAGDVEYSVVLLIKELWNATEDSCGWYMMGADGLRRKFESGISSRKVGFRELFSRYSSRFGSIVPLEKESKRTFYRDLITDILDANTERKELIPLIIRKCMVQQDGLIGGLRRAESLLILNS